MLMPVFHLTGTEDNSRLTTAEEKQQPFRWTNSVDQYLLVLDKGVHGTFHGQNLDYPELPLHEHLVKTAAVVFWRAYLLDDAEALEWLQGSGYAAVVGDTGQFEFKPKR